MKLVTMMMCIALCATAGASQAAQRGDPQARARGLLAPPAPPAPPGMPVPPTPPLAPEAPVPPVPPVPAIAPPAPPAPPPLPAIPDAAHAACAGKAIGSQMSFHPRRGTSMRGTCEKDAKGMYFELQEYRSAN